MTTTDRLIVKSILTQLKATELTLHTIVERNSTSALLIAQAYLWATIKEIQNEAQV